MSGDSVICNQLRYVLHKSKPVSVSHQSMTHAHGAVVV